MLKSFKSLIILLILTILLSACDWGRTPSNIRFAKNCNVKFPSDVQVIKDEYEGMGNDWAIYYTIKLTRPEMVNFISKVKRLNIYYSQVWRAMKMKAVMSYSSNSTGKEHGIGNIIVTNSIRIAVASH